MTQTTTPVPATQLLRARRLARAVLSWPGGRRARPGQAEAAVQVGGRGVWVDWLLRDRTTGKIVIAQFPNIPLIAWLAATGVSVVTTGTAHGILVAAAAVALVVWAGDEVLRGVNPLRRLLGAAVLAWEAYSLISGN